MVYKIQKVVCSLGLATVVACSLPAHGQYPASYSQTGPEAANIIDRQKQGTGSKPYNMKVGPVKFALELGVRQEYNDNVTLAKGSGQLGDLITSPHIGVNAFWPITKLNTLDFTIGTEYSKYWQNPDLDTQSIIITPNSLLDFNIYVGDVKFNIFDRISLQEDPISQPQLSGTSKFRRLENTAGVRAEWDLNKILLSVGYERYTFKALNNGSGGANFSGLDHDTDMVIGTAGYRMNPDMVAGAQVSVGQTRYSGTQQNNSTSQMAGLFFEGLLSEHLSAVAQVSYEQQDFSTGGSIGDGSNFGGIVFQVALENELNRYFSHNLQSSRYTIPGIGTNYTELTEIRYGFTWELFKDVDLTGNLFYQTFDDSGNLPISEDADRYGASLLASYPLFRSWLLSIGYEMTAKQSSISANDYLQNRVFLDLTYHF